MGHYSALIAFLWSVGCMIGGFAIKSFLGAVKTGRVLEQFETLKADHHSLKEDLSKFMEFTREEFRKIRERYAADTGRPINGGH